MKRLLSVLLSLCMVLSILPSVYAAEGDAEAMKTALLAVKNKIEIPHTYAQFEFNSSTTNGALVWDFYWTDSNGNGISVTADKIGRIVRYRHNRNNHVGNRFPNMTKAEAVEVAKQFLSETHPEIADKLALQSVNAYRYSNRYDICFVREEYGISVSDQTLVVEVDYSTKECVAISSRIDYDTEIKAPGKLIGEDAVFSKWVEMADLTLEYEISGENIGELRYTVKGDIRPIDAESGEIIPEDVVWKEGVSEDSTTSGGGASNETFRDRLTPEEEEKNQELAGLISKEKADSVVRSYPMLALGKSDTLYSARLYRDTSAYGEKNGSRSYWSLEYSGPVTKGENPEHAYACVDAKTGVLLSFRAYRYSDKNTWKLSEKTALTNAKAMLKVAASDVKTKIDDGVRTDSAKDPIPAEYRFRFGRVEKSIPVSNNQITVSVSSASGKVTEYTRTWSENAVFEDPAKIISEDEAEDILKTHRAPLLAYYTQTVYLYDIDSDSESVDWYYSGIPTEKKITLSYLGPENVRSIDAISKNVDEWGGVKPELFETYSDIKGHFAEREIQILLDIGILPSGEKFEPNRQMTQMTLLQYILGIDGTVSLENEVQLEALYKSAIARGIISAQERNPSKPVTRTDAARMIVRFAGYETLAKNPSIFRADYRDAASIPQKDLGYVMIAKQLGIMSGNGGYFHPNRIMTRGEAICMICKYLGTRQ